MSNSHMPRDTDQELRASIRDLLGSDTTYLIPNGVDELEWYADIIIGLVHSVYAIHAIDLDDLARQIRTMNHKTPLYKVLKTELGARGWWKNKARWQPPKGRILRKGDKLR